MLNDKINIHSDNNTFEEVRPPAHEAAIKGVAAAALQGAEVTSVEVTYYVGDHLRDRAGPGDVVIEDGLLGRRLSDSGQLPPVPSKPSIR